MELDELRKRLVARCEALRGRAGFFLWIPGRGVGLGHREDERFPTASTIKTGVMVAAMRAVDRGELALTSTHPVPPASGRQPSMWSYWFRDGVTLDLDGWVNLMITVSDNTATMVVRDWLGTMAVNRELASLGLSHTMILGNAPPEETEVQALRRQFGMGVSTPREMTTLLTMILEGRAASPGACDRMARILSHQYWDDYLGAGLPIEVKVASKSGAIGRSRSDAAIVYGPEPFVLSVYTDGLVDQRWTLDNEGVVMIREVSKLVWNALNPDRPAVLPEGWERFAPTGGGVEDS